MERAKFDSSRLNKDVSRAHLALRLCVGILLVLNLAFYTRSAPVLRLVELTVCREYYATRDPGLIGSGGYVEEKSCKVDQIQKKVAWLFALDQLLHFCCDFVATLPLGFLATRVGPKPVMLLNFTGFILSWAWMVCVCYFYQIFSVNMVLLAPLFTVFGGASHVMTAIIYSGAAMFTENRTATFSVLEAVIQVSQLIGPIIGSSLLMLGIYVPYYFIFPVALLSIPLTLCLPHRALSGDLTKPHLSRQHSPVRCQAYVHPEEQHLLSQDPSSTDQRYVRVEGTEVSYSGSHVIAHGPKTPRLRSLRDKMWADAKHFSKIFKEFPVVRYSYAALLVTTLGKQALHILLQYVSKRFNVSVAQAGFLFSIKAVVALVLYTLILPFAQRIMGTDSNRSNIRLARLSIVLLALGTSLIGISWNIWALIPGLVVYAFGFGFPVLARSLVTSTASANNIPIPLLYSGLAIAETVGSFIGATVLTAAFTGTISQGGVIAGIPFFVCAFFYGLIAVPTWTMNLNA
ncbi:MAG: hypothetical protein FRX48_02742 [Lasallia pustulata]|uniref:Major facilitator superfamily domain, general substrate transporter n=1 Tax=Lasallia pustulata TaxID=136370 RepID=A0A5M8PVC2_9LECA|nr:MAG: hypothetical protein FRX48_02742 [Lasallia pustulata]